MSVIHRALKAAQREKSRLDTESGRQFAPVLVRVRTPQRDTTRRNQVLTGAGVVVVLAASFLWYRGSAADPLPDIPAVTSAMLTQALASDSASASPAASSGSVTSGASPRMADGRAVAPGNSATRVAVTTYQRQMQDANPASVVAAPARSDDGALEHRAPSPRQAGALRIAVEPDRNTDAARLFNEAIAAHRAGERSRARALYERLLVATPDDGDVLNNLAVLLSAEREFDRALGLLRRAVQVAPGNAGAWNNIGSILREQGHSEEAVGAYRQALAVDPRHQGARVGLAQQYLALNALSQARQLLEEALGMNPRLAEAHYTLGQVLERMGDQPGAIAAYGAFIRLAPSHLSRHVELVRRRVDALSGGA